jgi:hypothetical protein
MWRKSAINTTRSDQKTAEIHKNPCTFCPGKSCTNTI